MNGSYLNIVRESLYKEKNSKSVENEKSNRITCSGENNSKISFCGQIKNTKIKKNKSNTKKLINKNKLLNSAGNGRFKDVTRKHKKLIEQRGKVKRQKIEISYSLSPSTSETTRQKQSSSRTKKNELVEYVSDNALYEDFNLNTFFSSREQSCNESIIESHSGIDYEFLSNGISNVRISSSKTKPKKKLKEDQDKKDLEEIYPVNCKQVNKYNYDHEADHNEEESITVNSFLEEPNSSSISAIEVVTSEEVIELSSELEQKIDTMKEKNQSNCKYFDLGCQKLVILNENHSVPFYGLCSLKVLHGKLKILGYILNKKSKEIKVYSPRGSSLLVIKNVTDTEEDDEFKDIHPFLKSNEQLRDLNLSKTDSIFVCTLLEDSKITFLEKYISQQIFPKLTSSKSPQIIFEPKDKFNEIKINPKWDSILQYVNASTKMLIIGGKGVGKSTFLKYSINTLLNRFEKIRIVDLDPGQSEFSVPGCISAVTISEPILGPNYTHLRKTDRSYLSNINVGYEPRKYIRCIKTLMESLDLSQNCPTLINYMGFAQGIGLNIVSSAITIIRPTDVIQIDSKSHKKNFVTDITPKVVEINCTLFGEHSNNLHFNCIKITAMSDGNCGWSLEPRQVREMCVLAYFGRLGIKSLTAHILPIYKNNLDSVTIMDDQGRTISPAAVNANLVALCSSLDNDFFNVLGYGIVRGVDIQSRQLVLITPEPIDVLEKVVYLVLGSVSLPPSIHMTPNGITGNIPYVMEGELESLGQITRRTYIPVNRI